MKPMNQSKLKKVYLFIVMMCFVCSIAYGLGSGSDFLAFDQLAGSSNFDASYTYNSAEQGGIASYPLYHTSYEVFSMVKKFVDSKFEVY